jgi:hypothetical protein
MERIPSFNCTINVKWYQQFIVADAADQVKAQGKSFPPVPVAVGNDFEPLDVSYYVFVQCTPT